MKYASVEEAREMDGLRLALTAQTPGPWGISARALFDLRGVPYVPVKQDAMQANEALVEWTGRRNAPVAVWNDEPAVDGWLEIANLAERLGSGPSLFPANPVDRALAVGISAEICGNEGFGWSRRLNMISAPPPESVAPSGDDAGLGATIGAQYGMRADAAQAAGARVAGILKGLAQQLNAQKQAGSPYLVADRVSLCDLHWACFSILVEPLSLSECPVDESLLQMFASKTEEVSAALDPIVIEHRDRIWREHIGLPLDYLPE